MTQRIRQPLRCNHIHLIPCQRQFLQARARRQVFEEDGEGCCIERVEGEVEGLEGGEEG